VKAINARNGSSLPVAILATVGAASA